MRKTKFLIAIIAFASLNCTAQITKLLDFNGINGSSPTGDLYSDGTYLYGMTDSGGTKNMGVIFKIKPDGTGYSKLLDFDSINGKFPSGSLISDGIYLYGMTASGGKSNAGTIFKIKHDGTMYSKLLDFTGEFSKDKTGANPQGSLVFDGTFLYGMTLFGCLNTNSGNIFKIKPDGTAFDTLMSFNGINGDFPYSSGSLISDGIYLYGMTGDGGTPSYNPEGGGVVFKVKLDGTGDTVLLNFNGINGGQPQGSLITDGTYLYGMTLYGGVDSIGTIFKIKKDGTGFDTLLTFNGTNGFEPNGSLVYDGNFLYGMTVDNIFKIKPDGTEFSDLYDFDSINGFEPYGSLVYDGTFLYGMSSLGGTHDKGTIFKFQYCTTNCCFSHYTTAYDTLQNTFTLTVDASTVSLANSYYWNFGDGSFSTQGKPTHNYTKDSTYNVCLKVKTANGDSCSYCHIIGKDAQGSVYRVSGFTLKVVDASPLQTGIETNVSTESAVVVVYPNPNNGKFTITAPTTISALEVYNVFGEKIYSNSKFNQQSFNEIDLSNNGKGIYCIKLYDNTQVYNKKVIVQ